MRTSPEPRAGAARLHGLDGLRGLAALAVLVFHAWLYTMDVPQAGSRAGLTDHVLHELRLGLVLFFALSGFVLFRPWVRAALDGTPVPRLGAYALGRAARILPAYYLAVAGSIVLLWGLAGSPGVRLPAEDSAWRFLLFLQNSSGDTVMTLNPPLWTLAVEVSFYIVLPLLGWFALRLGPWRAAQLVIPVALTAIGLYWAWWTQEVQVPLPWRKSLPSMLPYFAAGMAGAVLAHGRSIGRPAAVALLATGGALIVADSVLLTAVAEKHVYAPWTTIVRDLPAAVGFGAILATVAMRPPGRILASRPLVALGAISYGLYLWNVPLVLWGRAHGLIPLDPLPAVLVLAPATAAVAAVSWFAVEKPVLALADRRRRAAAERRRRVVAGAAPARSR